MHFLSEGYTSHVYNSYSISLATSDSVHSTYDVQRTFGVVQQTFKKQFCKALMQFKDVCERMGDQCKVLFRLPTLVENTF